ELLQTVSCAIGFDRPNFHLTQSLTTKLGFSTQRLLRHQRVRTDRTSMDLFFDQVMQLEHVHDAHSDWHLEGFPRPAVKEDCLTAQWQFGFTKQVLHIG